MLRAKRQRLGGANITDNFLCEQSSQRKSCEKHFKMHGNFGQEKLEVFIGNCLKDLASMALVYRGFYKVSDYPGKFSFVFGFLFLKMLASRSRIVVQKIFGGNLEHRL